MRIEYTTDVGSVSNGIILNTLEAFYVLRD